MCLQVRWELTMSVFVFLGPAQPKQYLGNISIYDSPEGPDTFLHLTHKLGNVPVVLLCGDDQRPLDILIAFDAVHVQQISGILHLYSETHSRCSDPHCPHILSL